MPIISRELSADRIITFAELMELYFVNLFRREGVSMHTIRKAAKAAERRFGTKLPFSVKRFDTDGRAIFSTLCRFEDNKEIVEDLARAQLVFGEIIKPFFRKLEYGTQMIERYWPLEKSGRIVLDPERRFGQPIDAETGVPVDAILTALKAGHGQDEKAVAFEYEIPVEAVKAAIKYNKSLAA
ncbi:DUF433 domain-containing protein [Stratiformator vulcanicus]|uniref:DUF433 domain-containing protein n=1 Tax=Stratiformator vulcanicus TaxID=2527980 RepID=UPI0028775CC7|nr:DUF433 domain-containing protein [Stratiformator vulcanicus]